MTKVHIHHFNSSMMENNFSLQSIYHRNNNQSYLYFKSLSSVILILRIQLYQRSYRSASIIIVALFHTNRSENSFSFSRSPLLGNLKTEQRKKRLDVFLTVKWPSQGNWQFRPRWPPVLNSSPRETAQRIPTRLRSLHQFPRNVLPARPSG